MNPPNNGLAIRLLNLTWPIIVSHLPSSESIYHTLNSDSCDVCLAQPKPQYIHVYMYIHIHTHIHTHVYIHTMYVVSHIP
jgi:hypothetical protein